MRVLVLLAAAFLSAGSFSNRSRAQRAYAVNNASCNYVHDPVQKQACYNRANTQYAVQSQRELVEEQNARAGWEAQMAQNQALTDRCDAIVRNLLRCQMIATTSALLVRNDCAATFAGQRSQVAYGQMLCYEGAADCDGMRWCLSH